MQVQIDPNETLNGNGDGVTLNEAIVKAAAQLLADHVIKQAGKDLDVLVAKTREAAVIQLVAPLVEQTIKGPIRKTNAYGEALGAETTLKALVVETALKCLTDPVGRNFHYVSGVDSKDSRSLIEYFVARHIRAELETQIGQIAKDVVKVAKWGDQLSDDIENSITAALEDTAKRIRKEGKRR